MAFNDANGQVIEVQNNFSNLALTQVITSVTIRSGQSGRPIDGLYRVNAMLGTDQSSGPNLGLILGLAIPLGCIGNYFFIALALIILIGIIIFVARRQKQWHEKEQIDEQEKKAASETQQNGSMGKIDSQKPMNINAMN